MGYDDLLLRIFAGRWTLVVLVICRWTRLHVGVGLSRTAVRPPDAHKSIVCAVSCVAVSLSVVSLFFLFFLN